MTNSPSLSGTLIGPVPTTADDCPGEGDLPPPPERLFGNLKHPDRGLAK